jgi:hypothetical protein
MPRMSEEVAHCVVWLSTQDRFKKLLEHFRAVDQEMATEILMPNTPAERRELLVNVKARLQDEVLRLEETANLTLQRTGKV